MLLRRAERPAASPSAALPGGPSRAWKPGLLSPPEQRGQQAAGPSALGPRPLSDGGRGLGHLEVCVQLRWPRVTFPTRALPASWHLGPWGRTLALPVASATLCPPRWLCPSSGWGEATESTMGQGQRTGGLAGGLHAHRLARRERLGVASLLSLLVAPRPLTSLGQLLERPACPGHPSATAGTLLLRPPSQAPCSPTGALPGSQSPLSLFSLYFKMKIKAVVLLSPLKAPGAPRCGFGRGCGLEPLGDAPGIRLRAQPR